MELDLKAPAADSPSLVLTAELKCRRPRRQQRLGVEAKRTGRSA